MKTYKGCKTVDATPMIRGEYNAYRGWVTPEDENPDDEGYLVEYHGSPNSNHPNHKNYISWSPKKVFEDAYKEDKETTFLERLKEEHFELNNKIEKLEKFIGSELFTKSVSDTQQYLLTVQLASMKAYSACLLTRRADLKTKS